MELFKGREGQHVLQTLYCDTVCHLKTKSQQFPLKCHIKDVDGLLEPKPALYWNHAVQTLSLKPTGFYWCKSGKKTNKKKKTFHSMSFFFSLKKGP